MRFLKPVPKSAALQTQAAAEEPRMRLSARHARHVLIAALALCGLAEGAFAQTKVIGYIPSYKGLRAVADRTDLSKLTHLNIAFANPASGGNFLNGGEPACMEAATGAEIN